MSTNHNPSNKEKLRIVFMGTPEFAVETLKEIVENGFHVVGAVTAPDRPAGRGRKIVVSAVKNYAIQQGIPVLQPTNLKSEEFLSQLKMLDPNVQVVVAFRMLPKSVWNISKHGTFNLHASLLPQYRGAAPINWAIVNGETKSGVTTFFIDENIDTGNMIFQKEIPVGPEENAGKLHDKLMLAGANLVVETLEAIALGNINPLPQQKVEHRQEAPKLTSENTKIDWSANAKAIYDQIRGLSPYPGAWTYFCHGAEKLRCKILSAKYTTDKTEAEIGTVLHDGKELQVVVKDGSIILEEMQLPGKRNMKVKDLLNGFIVKENPHMR